MGYGLSLGGIKDGDKKIMFTLLINPPRAIGKGNIWKKIDRALPPLGLACIASYLESKNLEVGILDLQAEDMDRSQLQDYLNKARPDFIGITSTTVEIESALNLARLSKEILPDVKVIFGGAHASILPDEVLLNPEIDFVIRGEGEYTLCELINAKDGLSGISGLSYKVDGRVIHNPPREVIKDLDEMPWPAYHLLPVSRYRPSLGNYKRMPAISMVATRGCPGRCTFCYTGISGKKIRTRSAVNLVSEIKLLQREYGIKEISFYDDTFTAFKENIKDFCRRLIEEKIRVTWSCMSRVDSVDKEMLQLMKKSGCHQVGYGLESASPEILRNIGKPMSRDLVKMVVKLTREAGIDARAMFMLGNPGETEDTLKETINFAIELCPDIVIFNITTPYPGTQMYDWAKKNGYLLNLEWDKYDLSNIVMSLPSVSPETVQCYYRLAYKKFYFRPSFIIRRLSKIRSLSDIKNSFKSVSSILSFNKERKEWGSA